MSTVFRLADVKYQVFPNDHFPPHCHVAYGSGKAKVRIDTFEVLWSRGFS
jgi:hypothetical protein